MALVFQPSGCKIVATTTLPFCLVDSGSRFLLLVLFSVPTHQFPVDLGDLFQILLHLVVVLDPAADLLDLITGNRATAPMSLIQGHTQIPDRPVSFAASAFAVWVAAGKVALHQRATQNLAEGWQAFGQALASIVQGQQGELGEVLSYRHMAARSMHPNRENVNTNLVFANFPPILLSGFGINQVCEVPGQARQARQAI